MVFLELPNDWTFILYGVRFRIERTFPHPTLMKRIQIKNQRLAPSRLEAAAAVDQEISRIEETIRRLKIEFDIYFAGAIKRPPLEARARLEANLKRITDNRSLSYSQRYQLNSLIARFTSYRELWRRTMRARGEDAF